MIVEICVLADSPLFSILTTIAYQIIHLNFVMRDHFFFNFFFFISLFAFLLISVFMVNSVVEVLVVQLLIVSIKLSHSLVESNH